MSDVMTCEGCGRVFGYTMLRQGQCKRCWPEGFDLMPDPPIHSSAKSEAAAASFLSGVNTVFAITGALTSLALIAAGATGDVPLGVVWGLLLAFGTAIVWAVNRVFIALAQDVSAIKKRLENSDS